MFEEWLGIYLPRHTKKFFIKKSSHRTSYKIWEHTSNSYQLKNELKSTKHARHVSNSLGFKSKYEQLCTFGWEKIRLKAHGNENDRKR
jgi:hypothetical protein